jgi:cobalt-precorrin-5B (C1)-methyltransferase
LRRGWTTGACAAAAARAAYAALLTGKMPDTAPLLLPRGLRNDFEIARSGIQADGRAMVAIVKDAGDDPDVTHGATVEAHVGLLPPGSGLNFLAGDGVGTVTAPGLPLAIGEPAINPGPRQIIQDNLAAIADGAPLDLSVEISIPGGQALAEKTMNGRLGILGGLSVLGTNGVVTPYSCAAWIHAIHRGADVACALGHTHLGAGTGARSEAGVMAATGLAEQAMLDMGDFASATLKYVRSKKVARFSLGGGFAKFVKLAQGARDLHSARSQVDITDLTKRMERLGASAETVLAVSEAPSAGAVLALAEAADIPIADDIAHDAATAARALLGAGPALEIMLFDRAGRLLARHEG